MKKWRNIGVFLLILVLISLSACGASGGKETADVKESTPTVSSEAEGKNVAATENTSTESEKTDSANEEQADTQGATEAADDTASPDSATAEATAPEHSEILVVYFSATGTTKGVAERIAELESADIYEIVPAQPYTTEDLNYDDRSSRSTKEQNDPDVRPEFAGEPVDLTGYTTIYVGYPIWWGEEPRILDTFVESYDFGDAVMIPFCTSGGSGIGRSGKNLMEHAGSGSWQSGERLSAGISDADLQSFIDGYK